MPRSHYLEAFKVLGTAASTKLVRQPFVDHSARRAREPAAEGGRGETRRAAA